MRLVHPKISMERFEIAIFLTFSLRNLFFESKLWCCYNHTSIDGYATPLSSISFWTSLVTTNVIDCYRNISLTRMLTSKQLNSDEVSLNEKTVSVLVKILKKVKWFESLSFQLFSQIFSCSYSFYSLKQFLLKFILVKC